MRMPFTEVFQKNEDNSYSPRHTVRFGNAEFSPETTLRSGKVKQGFDIGEYVDEENIDVERLKSGEIRIKERIESPTT